jgi:hypothetical protein
MRSGGRPQRFKLSRLLGFAGAGWIQRELFALELAMIVMGRGYTCRNDHRAHCVDNHVGLRSFYHTTQKPLDRPLHRYAAGGCQYHGMKRCPPKPALSRFGPRDHVTCHCLGLRGRHTRALGGTFVPLILVISTRVSVLIIPYIQPTQ